MPDCIDARSTEWVHVHELLSSLYILFCSGKCHLSIQHGAHPIFVQNQFCVSRSCADCHPLYLMQNSCLLMQSYISDFSTLLDNSGLNSWIYAALTASFVVAGFSYQFFPVDTMNAIFGMSAEKGLEDVYLWQLIGGGIATGVSPIAFTQRVCLAILSLPSASALTYSPCFKSCMVQSKNAMRYMDKAIYPGSFHRRLHSRSACNLHSGMSASAQTNVLVGSLLCMVQPSDK